MKLLLFVLCIGFSTPCLCQNVVVITTGKSALIGSAYATDKENFIGAQCITGTTTPTGVSESSFHLDQSMDESQLANELGFSVGGHARFGAVEASLSAEFLSRSISNSFSVSAIYSAHYNFPPDKLNSNSVTYTTVGNAVKANFERWPQTCGDSFVDEIRRGAKLFVSVRVDFSSQQKKQEFSSKFSISGPLAGAEASLHTATQSYGQDVRVTISALQQGGDVSKLTQIFGSDAGRSSYTQCTLGSFDSCAKVIESVLAYAGDTSTGFPAQIAPGASPGPAILAYVVTSYKAYGIYPIDQPGLAVAVSLARGELSKRFERTYRQYITASRLLEGTLAPERQRDIQAAFDQVKANLSTILNVSKICYDTPEQCPEAERKMSLVEINEDILTPDSFATLCTQSLKSAANEPLPTSIYALVDLVDKGAAPKDAIDCNIYGRLLNRVKFFDLRNRHISDLSPMAGFINTERVALDNNDIHDLSPLADMSELQELFAGNNKISSLVPLKQLVQLNTLELESNRIASVSPLKELVRLKLLSLQGNQVTDIAPISELPSLEYLNLEGNNVADLSPMKKPLRLGCVNLRKNLLSDDQINSFHRLYPTTIVVIDKGFSTTDVPWGWACTNTDQAQ